MERHEEKLNLLYEVGRIATTGMELPHLLNQIMLMAQEVLHSVTSSILLVDDQTGELFFEAATGKAGDELVKSHRIVKTGVAAWVADNCRPLIVNDVSSDRRFNGEVDKCSGFTTESILCVPLQIGGRCTGVIEVINKRSGEVFNNSDLELLMALSSMAALAIENAKMHEATVNAYLDTFKLLSETIDAKDPYTRGHSQRVSNYGLIAAKEMGLSAYELNTIKYAGLLHDLGKVAVDQSILSKPGNLTPEEWVIMRNHSRLSAAIIADIPFLIDVKKLVLYHHERYDGAGYPERLSGELIPLGSRIIAVADTFDTMTTDRPYRKAKSVDAAVAELKRCSGTQFCPAVVKHFIAGLSKQQMEVYDMVIDEEAVKLKNRLEGLITQ